ncbi:MAG: hypothetical protein MJ135_02020 [Oscillospiraceae bacterium]|nr:hypothetical protein [Oscillospiraceae bacterium]
MYNEYKVYVDVELIFSSDGHMLPRSITWENGCVYQIDKVTEIRQAPALRAGGIGDRYTIWVNGRSSYLFFERILGQTGSVIGRWFVERRTA